MIPWLPPEDSASIGDTTLPRGYTVPPVRVTRSIASVLLVALAYLVLYALLVFVAGRVMGWALDLEAANETRAREAHFAEMDR